MNWCVRVYYEHQKVRQLSDKVPQAIVQEISPATRDEVEIFGRKASQAESEIVGITGAVHESESEPVIGMANLCHTKSYLSRFL